MTRVLSEAYPPRRATKAIAALTPIGSPKDGAHEPRLLAVIVSIAVLGGKGSLLLRHGSPHTLAPCNTTRLRLLLLQTPSQKPG